MLAASHGLGTLPLRVPSGLDKLPQAMPIYEYRCEDGHTFEVIQRFSDDPISECETCAKPVEKVLHPVAVHFKGKGFYNTDYGTKKRAREAKESKMRVQEPPRRRAPRTRSDGASELLVGVQLHQELGIHLQSSSSSSSDSASKAA